MCFTTADNRQIHTTAQQLLSRVPKDNGCGTKLAMPRHTKKITAYIDGKKITGAIIGFNKQSEMIEIKPTDAIEHSEHITVPFSTPAEKA